MNNKIIKICAVTGLVSLVSIPNLCTVKADNSYITWNNEITYEIKKELGTIPTTFEFKLQLPKTVTASGGMLLGNRASDNADCLNFEIASNGNPYLWIRSDNTRYTYKFTNVDVRTESEFVHLVVTRDTENKLINCYLNGELKQSLECLIEDVNIDIPMMLAGDRRPSNPYYYKGLIDSVALYSDVRTEAEIENGMNDFTSKDSNMILGYKLANLEDDYVVQDESDNDRDLQKIVTWVDDEDIVQPTNYDYSFAVVGDTQYACKNYSENFHKIYDYILDNVDTFNIQHVFGLGDITDASTKAEWALADEHISRMDGVVPYSLVRGNHDNEKWFDYVFGADTKYTNQYYNQYFDNYKNYSNTAHEFNTDILDYLVITLDFGATDDVLDWAAGLIESHPNHNVIITTHGYLAADGTTLDATDSGRPTEYGNVYNDGDEMWDKLIKKYPNIVMVLSGHIGSDNIVLTQTEGEHGNVVSQFLINPQYVDSRLGGVGLVSMFYISEGGSKVKVDYYSTYNERYFKYENQFEFTLATVERKPSSGGSGGSGTNNSSSTTVNSSPISSVITNSTNNNSVDNGANNGSNENLVPIVIGSVAGVSVLGIIIFVLKRKI